MAINLSHLANFDVQFSIFIPSGPSNPACEPVNGLYHQGCKKRNLALVRSTLVQILFGCLAKWYRTWVLPCGDYMCGDYKQTLALRQASEESACFLLSFFCDD